MKCDIINKFVPVGTWGARLGDPLVPYVTDKEQPGSITTVIFTELFPFSAVRRFLPPLSCTVGSCQDVLPTVDNCTGGTYLSLFFLRPFLHYINRTWSLFLLTFYFLIYFFSPPLPSRTYNTYQASPHREVIQHVFLQEDHPGV